MQFSRVVSFSAKMLLVDVMELFFLGLLAPGQDFTVITEHLNASSFLWRLRLMLK